MIEVGATVGNYQVLQKIGSGAMGNVWLAHHPVIGKRVALKVIHPELATNEEMIARFFNEARAVTQIGHENIVDVQDFGQTPDGDSFIVMELLEGSSLGDRLKHEGALSVPRATHIALQLADGLAAAHARGIIHRDLKPDNIFLVTRGGDPDFVKVLDFGLAKLTGPSQVMQNRTKTGSLLGTPHYMAPEQAENVKKVDHRADVYSLGCILFQMLTGRVPFPGEGFGEVLVRHVREPPPLPSRLNPAVPPAIEKIVLHALAKKPEFRFASMDEFRTALRDPERFAQTLDGQGGIAPTPDAGIPAVGPVVAGVGPPPPAPPPPAAGGAPAPRVSHDAPTLLAQAPDPALIQRAAAAASARQPAAPARPVEARRPDPARVVQPRPAKATVAEPLARRRREAQDRALDRVPRSRAGLWVAAAALLVLGGVVGWYFVLGPGRGGHIAVTVVTEPPGAMVLEGEQVLGTAPLVARLPRGSGSHTFTVRLDGYLTAQRLVTTREDQALRIRLMLQPKPEEEAPPATAPAATPTPSGATPTPSGATPTPSWGTAPATTPGRSLETPTTPPEPAAATPPPPVRPPHRHHPKPSPKPKQEHPLILTPSF